MPRYSVQAELAPRDVVARAILNEMLTEQTDFEYLDLRHLPSDKMHARFPTISAFCRQHGLDLATDLLPIAPAAHYFMGGVMVDTYGRTTLPGLWAVGEVACTGVHGANRLASNSLLEGLVYGLRTADSLVGVFPEVASSQRNITFVPYDDVQGEMALFGHVDERTIKQLQRELRQVMWQYVSLCRDEQGLREASRKVQALGHKLFTGTTARQEDGKFIPRVTEAVNMLLVAQLVVLAALERCESRGSHWHLDYQATDDSLAAHHFVFQRSKDNSAVLLQAREEVILHA
jgi:L-aspartate oxidase